MAKKVVYLAGAVELTDTWRGRAEKELRDAGFEPLNPLRGEECKAVGKHLVTNVTDKMIVARDLNDLRQVKQSAGVCLMHFKTTAEGRQPTATIAEMMWCYLNAVPIVAVIGPKCSPVLREHPWVKVMVASQSTSLTGAIETIIESFS
jgi:hypothetical protein